MDVLRYKVIKQGNHFKMCRHEYAYLVKTSFDLKCKGNFCLSSLDIQSNMSKATERRARTMKAQPASLSTKQKFRYTPIVRARRSMHSITRRADIASKL